MAVEIIYTDEFDKEHYPFGEQISNTLEKIAEILYIPKPEDSKWYYFCTIHGAIFKTSWAESGIAYRNGNLGVEQLKYLADLDGLRWIESNKEGFTIGLEFRVVR